MIFLSFEEIFALQKNVSYRVVGLEVDPHHRTQFEVDEQQQNVIDFYMTGFDHLQKLHHCRPGCDGTDGEQRQVMEGFDKQVAQGFGQLMDVLAKVFGPVYFHEGTSLGRLDRIMRDEGDGFLHAEKRPGAQLRWQTAGTGHVMCCSKQKCHYPNPKDSPMLLAV